MMRLIKWLALFCLFVVGAGALTAQETGQICIFSFDDQDESGVLDANEPPITQGVGISLLNERGVTIESQLLEDSPQAARGLVCFVDLPAGDYRVLLTSADYIAMTSSSFQAAVVPGSVPVRFDFGVKPLTSENATAAAHSSLSQAERNLAGQGILVSAAAAAIVSGMMVIIGLFIYFAAFRPRMKRKRSRQAPTPSPQPNEGISQPFHGEDTDQTSAV